MGGWHRDGEAWRQNADNFCGNKLLKAITKPKHTCTHTHSVLIKYACVCVGVCVVGVASTAVRHLAFRYCALIARNLRQANPARSLVISPRWAVKTPLWVIVKISPGAASTEREREMEIEEWERATRVLSPSREGFPRPGSTWLGFCGLPSASRLNCHSNL